VVAIASGSLAASATAQTATPPTNAEFVAAADQICSDHNKKNLSMLKRSRALIFKGKERAGGRLLIRAEHFELDYYGEIADLPRPVDPAFNELVDDFLRNQRGQARSRIKVGQGLIAGSPGRKINRWDSQAVRQLKAAGRASALIGFTRC
jgi:hypothetical protein